MYAGVSRPVGKEPLMLRRLLRAKDHIDGAPDEEWPVSRLAHVSGISQAHFARAFRQAFGIPPHRYLLTRRIERAKALLRDSEMTITEIAYAVGWNSLGTFTRTFRDVTGHAPNVSRQEQKAIAHAFEHVPHCFVSAAHRPDLKIAVSEKRRIETPGTEATKPREVS